MLTAFVLGIFSSTLTEIVNALNKRLANTVLRGDGAFLLAFVIAIVAAAGKVFYIDGVPFPTTPGQLVPAWTALAPSLGMIWTVSQVYFLLVVQKLNLDVQPPTPTPVPPTAGASI